MKRASVFPAVPQSVHAARRFATDALAGGPRRELEAVELMVSELATNCIRHERATFHVSIWRSDAQLRVEVTDAGGGRPRLRSPAPDEPSGRGLQIVEMLADRWGVAPESPEGKTVWFELDLAPAPHDNVAVATAVRLPVAAPSLVGRNRSTVQAASGRGARSAQGCRLRRRYPGHELCRDERRRRPAGERGAAARP